MHARARGEPARPRQKRYEARRTKPGRMRSGPRSRPAEHAWKCAIRRVEGAARPPDARPSGSLGMTAAESDTRRFFTMLHYAVVFFIIALIAAVFGFGGIAAGAAGIAKVLFVVFLVVAVATLLLGRRSAA
jgi:uncharacterized membrane protein YtjA (UPF0391 family)